LVFDEVVPMETTSMGRQEATRPDSDSDEESLCSHYALARLTQVPIFKVLVRPGRDSNHDLPDTKQALCSLGHKEHYK